MALNYPREVDKKGSSTVMKWSFSVKLKKER